MSYCETAWTLPCAADGVPSLPAYTVSAWANPAVMKPAGSIVAPSSPHSAPGCPVPAGLGAASAGAAGRTASRPPARSAMQVFFILPPCLPLVLRLYAGTATPDCALESAEGAGAGVSPLGGRETAGLIRGFP